VERKIRKQALIYGLAAILLATVLGAFIFSLGTQPLQQLSPEPPIPTPFVSLLETFTSKEEVKEFLTSSSGTTNPFPYFGRADVNVFGSVLGPEAASTAPSTEFKFDYSSTNVQVTGVDELDVAKADDQGYMYVVTGDTVMIVKAYPPENAGILSRISLNGSYPIGIFVWGNRLAVLGSRYVLPYRGDYGYFVADIRTYINVYDIEDRTKPTLLREFTLTGSYFNSRMVGDYAYFVISQPACIVDDSVPLPTITTEDQTREIAPTDIHYFNGSAYYYQYTTFIAMNMQNTTEAPVYLTLMLGSSSNMYVSLNNIYITAPEAYDNTTIHRIQIRGSNLTYEAKGYVPGRELNQFSMDEYADHFRIVTTTWSNYTRQTNVYALDMNLSTVGMLEGLAVGENFHSSRFMGERCYLVTFETTDPLFVINLTEPAAPSVLGELKIPGYSDYLHPFDETHLIGVGKETVEAEGGFFAWYQGIKISLFDVSNVTDPKQMANYTIGDRGSDSPILHDHKAFLFDKSRSLLAIPVLVAEIDESQYPGGVPSNAYGQPVWQGVQVFNVTLEHGFQLRGAITHLDDDTSIGETSYYVKRSLYIENVFYTVSDRKIVLNDLDSLAFIKETVLS
jgi:uncharacterized secreted protein with C-terminal beta-propeller domain